MAQMLILLIIYLNNYDGDYMKKCKSLLSVVLILLVFTSCVNTQTFEQQIANLTNEEIININKHSLISDGNLLCKYGDYFVSVKHNVSDLSNSVVILNEQFDLVETLFNCQNEIKSIKAINNNEICVVQSDAVDYYTVINLKTKSVENEKIDIKCDDTVISIIPYFHHDNVFFDVTACKKDEYEPFHKIYKQVDNSYVCLIPNCSQFQFLEDGIVFEFGGKIIFHDNNDDERELLNFDLDKVFSKLVNKYIVTVNDVCYDIIDVFENKKICSTSDISHSSNAGLEGNVYIVDGKAYFITLNGIEQLDFANGKTKLLSKLKPDSLTIIDNNLCFELDRYIFCVDINNQSTTVLT